MLRIITTVLLLACFLKSNAQERIYGVWEDQTAGNYKFVSLEPSTGTKQDIAVIAGMSALYIPNNYAMIQHDSTYVVLGMVGGNPNLFHIDVATGATLNQNVVNDIMVGYQYNCADSLLYAIWVDANAYWMVNLDPATGAKTTLYQIAGLDAYAGGTFVLNSATGDYTFLGLSGSQNRTFVTNIYSQITYDDVFPGNLVGQVYGCRTDSIYGMWEDQSNGSYNLMHFDPLGPTQTVIDSVQGILPGYVGEAYSIDGPNGLYNFMGFVGQTISWISVDITDASVVYSNPASANIFGWGQLDTCCATVFPPPVADFVGDTLSFFAPYCVNFTDLSTGNPDLWTWSFPGGTPSSSNQINPQNICYDTPGCYDVTLIVSNMGGADTLTFPCYIDVLPLGYDEYSKTSKVYLSPMPVIDGIELQGEDKLKYNILEVIGCLGGDQGTYRLDNGAVQLLRPELPAGLYFYILRGEGVEPQSGKLILR